MKKKMLLFIFLFFISIMSVSAYVTAGDDCEKKGTCIAICSYNNKIKEGGSYATGYQKTDGFRYVTIYYNFDKNNLSVSWWDSKIGDGHSPKSVNKENFSDVFQRKNYVFVDPNVNLTYSNFECPKHAYYDLDSINGGNEVCFDDNGKWCSNEGSGWCTTFGKKAGDTFQSDTRTMTYEEEIDYWFKNTSLNEVTLEAVMSGKYKTAEDIWEKIVLVDFKKNYLHGHNDLPEFIANSDAFKEGHKKVAKEFKRLKSEWIKELDEKKENGKITEEKYNETIKKLEDIDENIEETGKDFSERFNVIKGVQDKLPVDDVDICEPGSKSLKVFQVIGYFLLIAKIIAPIILIILGSITFGKAALSNDEKAVMDAAVMFGKKVLIGLIIFFVPTVLDYGLSLVSGVSNTMQKFEPCTACILSPNDSSRCSPQNLQDGTTDNNANSKDKDSDKTDYSGSGGSSTGGKF